jgi:hypothetical protein
MQLVGLIYLNVWWCTDFQTLNLQWHYFSTVGKAHFGISISTLGTLCVIPVRIFGYLFQHLAHYVWFQYVFWDIYFNTWHIMCDSSTYFWISISTLGTLCVIPVRIHKPKSTTKSDCNRIYDSDAYLCHIHVLRYITDIYNPMVNKVRISMAHVRF